MRIGPPPGVSLDDALGSSAATCAAACPTGAITLQGRRTTVDLAPILPS